MPLFIVNSNDELDKLSVKCMEIQRKKILRTAPCTSLYSWKFVHRTENTTFISWVKLGLLKKKDQQKQKWKVFKDTQNIPEFR